MLAREIVLSSKNMLKKTSC